MCGESRTHGVEWGKIQRLPQRITYHYPIAPKKWLKNWQQSAASTLNSTKVIRLNGFWQRRKFKKKFMTLWKRKFSSNKKFGHSQKEEDQFFYVKKLELSNGLLYDKILKKKEGEP